MEPRGTAPLLSMANISVCVPGALWRLAGIQLGRVGKAGEGEGEEGGLLSRLGRRHKWPWPLSRLGEGTGKWPVPVWDIGKYMLFL